MDMNKEWMMAPRLSNEYLKGVEDFLEFLRANRQKLGGDDWYCCPCVKCRNIVGGKKTLRDIREHLICDGIDTSYTRWIHHGEIQSTSTVNIGTINNNEDAFPRMVDMVNDVFARIPNEDGVEYHMGGCAPTCMDETNHEEEVHAQDNSPEGIQYKKLMEDAMQPLYPSCRIDDTKLSVTVELLSMKARHKWSNKSFNELLQLFKRVLPEHNALPDNTYNAKKIVDSLRMEEKIIHACRNDCILYWREHEENDNCPTCGLSRWKPINPAKPRAVRLPWKKLRYFPITPRLQRMYSVPWIAESMTWHANASLVPNDSIMRHPVDSSCWKQVDRKNPHFAFEARNVRLGLATNGFSPFGIKNNAYSCWPVMVVPYNLPPSLCMRKEFTMLTLLIPGKKGPGHDIDIYLQPLIAELNELWSIGTITYDSYNKNRFTMKAILLWVIHDFPAYGHLSGCRTAGRYACPVCGEETDSQWLKHGKKCIYMEHRRFLPNSRHPFRSQKSQFNGKEEHRQPPRRLSGSELLSKMENTQTNFGKSKKRKRHADELNSTPWTKRSIFFDLPYWKVRFTLMYLEIKAMQYIKRLTY